MGIWKKALGWFGRTAVTAAAGALEAKASGKPITIGTVGPEVLEAVLRDPDASRGLKVSGEISEGDRYPSFVKEGTFVVQYPVYGLDGLCSNKVRFFEDSEQAVAYAMSIHASVGVAIVDKDGRLKWVPAGKGK